MKKNVMQTLLTVLLAIGCFCGCSRSKAEPEIKGPDETIVMNLVDVSNIVVGTLYIDNMRGRAQARIVMHSGYYTPGQNMKSKSTLSVAGINELIAHCSDVNGNNGRCVTFPIRLLRDNADARFEQITQRNGIVFNILDRNNQVFARSAPHSIVIDN